MSEFIKDFKDISSADLSVVGGKGANLGEMTGAGFSVPQGFAVTTEAFRVFLQKNNFLQFVENSLSGLSADETARVAEAGKKIRDTLMAGLIPLEIKKDILLQLESYNTETAFAVRSSATAEDLPDASFAGQQDTYLNIIGGENIIDAVKSCWASLYTDRAITYRIKNNFSHKEVFISVIIQEMVFSDISGIMFTADPVSQNRNRISIDASYGLGEALVSGLVSADNYLINYENMTIAKKQLGAKENAIILKGMGGVEKSSIAEEKQKSFSLTDEEALMVAAEGKKIEDHYGQPQDIEWCITDGKFYVVQSRPITTLYPLVDGETWHKRHVYISFGHLQNMMTPIKPMGQSFIRTFIPFGKDKDSYECKYLPSAGGRIYFDVTDITVGFPITRKVLPKFLFIAEVIMRESLLSVLERREFRKRFAPRIKHMMIKRFVGTLLPLLKTAVKYVFFKDTSNLRAEFIENMDAIYNESKEIVDKAEPGADRVLVCHQVLDDFGPRLIANMPRILSGVVALGFLKRKMKSFDLDEHFANIQSGLGGNVTTAMDLAVGDLADLAVDIPRLNEYKNITETSEFIKKLDLIKGAESFKKAFIEFMELYGHRANGEIDLTANRWNENPASLLNTLMGGGENRKKGSHRVHYEEQQRLSAESEKIIVETAGKKSRGLGKTAQKMITNYRNTFCLREHPKYYIMKIMGMMKEYLLKDALILVEQGIIDEPKDIYFLYLNELKSAFLGALEVKKIIEERKKNYELYNKMTAPRIITDEGETVEVYKKRDDLPQGALGGTGVSAGVIEGYARVVLDPTTDEIHEGEILIAPFTDPGWTPLFIHARGLVMEVGGMLTHGSVVAREYGIPAVVCVPDATTLIKTGQKIRVNGSEGIVEILEGENK
jgi:phosphohistidine swiveling domain-containing protein